MSDSQLTGSLIESRGDTTLRHILASVDYSRKNELTLRDLLQVFRRRRLLIYGAVCGAFLLGVLACVFTTRRYVATGTIQVQKESSEGLNRETLTGAAPLSSDALEDDITIQTQARILQSNELALRTIYALKLEDTDEFALKSGLRLWWQTPKSHSIDAAREQTNHGDTLQQQAQALTIFRKNLAVEAIGGTRIIEIKYLNRDPKLAASVVNRLVQELVAYNFETGYQATQVASEALGKQLVDLRSESEKLQAEVAQMQRQSGIYSIGTTDAQGRQQAYSAVLEQFQRASVTLSETEQTRILKEAIYDAAKSGDAEMLSSLAGNTATGAASSGIMNSLTTIQNLRSQEATLQGQLDQLKVKFDVGYPKMAELQANIDSLENSVHQEVKRIAKRAENDYSVANRTYYNAKKNYDEQKVQADALNDRATQYMITHQEADESRSLYEDLLKRLKEAGILQGLKSNTIAVVDQALIPTIAKQPNVPLYLAAGLGLGLFVGGFCAIVTDLLDDSIWDEESIEQMGCPVIGMVPTYQKRGRVDATNNPPSRYGDGIRNLRLHLMRPTMGTAIKVILVTCATPDENKDELCGDLASSFAQAGKKVLLIESDRSYPAFSGNGGPPVDGPSDILTTKDVHKSVAKHPRVPGLFVLACDSSVHNPSALLDLQLMQQCLEEWRTAFDFIVINAPPVIRFGDARFLSEMADVTVQLARYRSATRTSLKRAHALLSTYANGNVGIVFTGVPNDSKAT